jgi:uncharacterized protein with von Willebrand factor type A (vWA) domain
VHAYQQYDPKQFPPPTQPPTPMSDELMDRLLAMGDLDDLSDEDLANAIRLDPATAAEMMARMGPPLASIRRMLLERKRKILETYEVDSAQQEAARQFVKAAAKVRVPDKFRKAYERAVRERQIYDLERLYEMQRDDTSDAAKDLLRVASALSDQVQIEQLADAYSFTGRTAASIPEAIELKDELERIDELLRQLDEAAKNAQVAIIDMDMLGESIGEEQAEELKEQIEALNKLAEQIEEARRQQAERMGLQKTRDGYRLTPAGLRALQKTLLTQVFDNLRASRSGRHSVGIVGSGVVQTEKTRPYQFGDDAGDMDAVQTLINAAASMRGTREQPARGDDIAIRLTRNNPKCATSVIMDMSGSMRYDGLYVSVKKMALALDALIRGEYPGDWLNFIEMYSVAKIRHASELMSLLPKPVSIHSPRVRLRADMSKPDVTEAMLPQHFTNIQHALRLARQTLGPQNTPNKQVLLITDGLPTAHFAGKDLYFLYPPDALTAEATMREALACQREGITINVFLLQSWNQSSEDVAFARAMAEQTRGRVLFTAGRELDRYVVWDYVSNRRRVIGA